ncbi:MAG: TRAP transporter small permease [Deltaproteobacteria bacterium]|nr:TRAP transporter small permease [Deltaproteobacteria bacterium]
MAMKPVGSIIERVADISGYFSGWLVPLMMILIAVEVFMRYVLHQPLMVADEFSAYMLVALSYLGLAYTWKQGGHVRISLLVSRLPSKISSRIRLIALILILIFMIELDRAGYKMIVYALKINLRSQTFFTFPLFWPQLTVFIGFILLTLLLFVEIARAILKIRAGERVEA